MCHNPTMFTMILRRREVKQRCIFFLLNKGPREGNIKFENKAEGITFFLTGLLSIPIKPWGVERGGEREREGGRETEREKRG